MARGADVAEVARRRYWREADARVVVEAWRSEGGSLGEFARRHGVQPRRLKRWTRKLEAPRAGSVRFHPVRIASVPLSTSAIEIELRSGWCVRVGHGFEPEDLRRVIAVLEEARC